MALPPASVDPPLHDELVRDLRRWRAGGVLKLRLLGLPALRRAAIASGLADTTAEAAEPAVVKDLVRRALTSITGSATGRCALVLLGLDPNTFDVAPHLLREDAAEIYGVSWERFRREPQARVLGVVADAILEQCVAHRARLARLALERRHPADTRLAVHWLERFEAYFQIWTPVYALAADLTAYRATVLEPDRPWDRLAEGEDDPAYSQEDQAGGYASFALFHFAGVMAALQAFVARYGGLWLLSSAQAEAHTRDALYAVASATTMNERDRSWLRTAIDEAGGEMDGFMARLDRDSIGLATLEEWQEWLDSCRCSWAVTSHDPEVEYFPTARYHEGIEAGCLVHQTVEAANRYCTIIEGEWMRVADWYLTARPFSRST